MYTDKARGLLSFCDEIGRVCLVNSIHEALMGGLKPGLNGDRDRVTEGCLVVITGISRTLERVVLQTSPSSSSNSDDTRIRSKGNNGSSSSSMTAVVTSSGSSQGVDGRFDDKDGGGKSTAGTDSREKAAVVGNIDTLSGKGNNDTGDDSKGSVKVPDSIVPVIGNKKKRAIRFVITADDDDRNEAHSSIGINVCIHIGWVSIHMYIYL
jgi:hypothetical protein